MENNEIETLIKCVNSLCDPIPHHRVYVPDTFYYNESHYQKDYLHMKGNYHSELSKYISWKTFIKFGCLGIDISTKTGYKIMNVRNILKNFADQNKEEINYLSFLLYDYVTEFCRVRSNDEAISGTYCDWLIFNDINNYFGHITPTNNEFVNKYSMLSIGASYLVTCTTEEVCKYLLLYNSLVQHPLTIKYFQDNDQITNFCDKLEFMLCKTFGIVNKDTYFKTKEFLNAMSHEISHNIIQLLNIISNESSIMLLISLKTFDIIDHLLYFDKNNNDDKNNINELFGIISGGNDNNKYRLHILYNLDDTTINNIEDEYVQEIIVYYKQLLDPILSQLKKHLDNMPEGSAYIQTKEHFDDLANK